MKRKEYLYTKDAMAIFNAIASLQEISGCESVVSTLTKKLEKHFKDVPDKNGEKKIENLSYYSNGLIKSLNCAVIASPWEMTSGIEVKVKKKSIEQHKYCYILRKSELWALLLRNANNQKITPKKNLQLTKLVKSIEAMEMLPEDSKKIIPLHHQDVMTVLRNIAMLFRENYYKRTYITKKQCADILKIYHTLDPENKKDNQYSYNGNDLISAIEHYLSTQVRPNLPNVMDLTEVKKLESKISINQSNTYYTTDNEKQEALLKENEVLSKELSKEYYLLAKACYINLYNIEDENVHSLLIKLKVIEEGYLPKL